MDAGLFLLVPHKLHIPDLEYFEKTISWEGKDYPQGLARYLWGEHCTIREDRVTEWALNRIPEVFKDESIYHYLIEGKCLDNLELEVNGRHIEWHGHHLLDLIENTIDDKESWAMVFIWQWDTLDHITEGKRYDAIEKLKDNLNWDKKREGFAVFHIVEKSAVEKLPKTDQFLTDRKT